MQAALSRRERKKQETRQALSAAALRLTTERGLEGVTVDDIANEADVSTRTLFNYFASKEAAIVGIDPDNARMLAERLLERPAHEPPIIALRAVLVDAADDDDLAVAAAQRAQRAELVARHPALLPHQLAGYAALERVLVTAMRERVGAADDDPFPTVAVAAAIAAIRSGLNWHAAGSDGRSLRDVLEQALEVVGSGLDPALVRHPSPAAAARRLPEGAE